jgi:hypothetical protein
MQRTVRHLTEAISEKFQVDPNSVLRVTHQNARGLQIIVDEDVVRELAEEQEMIVEFAKPAGSSAVKSETTGDELDSCDQMFEDGLEMWLNY